MKSNDPRSACFEGSPAGNPAAADAAATAAAATAADAGGVTQPTDDNTAQAAALAGPDGKITQAQLNKILAAERRKNEEKTARIQATLEATLESKNLTVAEREQLQNRLDAVKNETRTVAEKAKAEIDKAKAESTAATKRAEEYQRRFYDSQVERQITDASITEGAFSPQQMVAFLRPMTQMVQTTDEQGRFTGDMQPVTKLPMCDASGNQVIKESSPAEAVKAMKGQPQLYGNLFKSGVVSGIGSGSGAGVSVGGKIDVRNLTPQQYAEIRAKNPELLGLRRDKRNRI